MAPYVFAQAHSKEKLSVEDFMPSRMGQPKRRKTGQELMAAFIAAGAKVAERKR